MSIPKLYNIQETARHLRVTPRTVRYIIKKGELRTVRIGDRRLYITEEELLRYINRD